MKLNPFNIRVSLDSRLIKKNDYFVPVVGESKDGRKYLAEAKRKNAKGIIEEDELYKLALEKLNKVNPKVITITGSVGKSTTTTFIASVLSNKYKVAIGYQNTKLGLAVDIINNLKSETEYFVAECGMDRSGELLEIGKYIKPDIVVVTNVSESHMEKLGSIENIIKAKGELLKTVNSKGKVYINWDSKFARRLIKFSNTKTIIKYSYKDIGVLPKTTHLIGKHNLLNAICTILIAKDLGLSTSQLNKAAAELETLKGRLKKLKGNNGSFIIDDTYNSSPASSKYAIDSVLELSERQKLNGRKIAILGGMLELGKYKNKGHKIIGKKIIASGFDHVILFGKLAKKFNPNRLFQSNNLDFEHFDDYHKAATFLIKKLKIKKGDIILIKASQGIRLEKLVKLLLEDPSQADKLLVRQDARWT